MHARERFEAKEDRETYFLGIFNIFLTISRSPSLLLGPLPPPCGRSGISWSLKARFKSRTHGKVRKLPQATSDCRNTHPSEKGGRMRYATT